MTREQAINYLFCSGFSEEQVSEVVRALTYEPTTKNCESCRYYGSHHEVCKYCYKCSLLTQGEPTTKNDLGVDAVSRQQAIERLKLNFPISDGADNSRDRHRYMQALADIQAIRELPSVTPQEPTGKKFTKADIDAIVKAINTGWELRVNEILDKIRAEIDKARFVDKDTRICKNALASGLEVAMQIIDKYKAETEE